MRGRRSMAAVGGSLACRRHAGGGPAGTSSDRSRSRFRWRASAPAAFMASQLHIRALRRDHGRRHRRRPGPYGCAVDRVTRRWRGGPGRNLCRSGRACPVPSLLGPVLSYCPVDSPTLVRARLRIDPPQSVVRSRILSVPPARPTNGIVESQIRSSSAPALYRARSSVPRPRRSRSAIGISPEQVQDIRG